MVQSTLAWRPEHSGIYTVEATIDVDNRFSEENETDNVIMLTLPISVPNLLYLPILLRDASALE